MTKTPARRKAANPVKSPLRRKPQSANRVAHATRDSIVSAAAEVLIRGGYAMLSLRRVAEAAGISVGNLNYHFRTKEALLEALIERTLSAYSDRFESLLSDDQNGFEDAVNALTRWVMTDAASHEYTLLFREMWAMASHNASVAAALDDFYDRSISAAMAQLARHVDAARMPELRTLVVITCFLSEGASVVFGLRKTSRANLKAIIDFAAHGVGLSAAALPRTSR